MYGDGEKALITKIIICSGYGLRKIRKGKDAISDLVFWYKQVHFGQTRISII